MGRRLFPNVRWFSYMDDVTLAGPIDETIAAFKWFRNELLSIKVDVNESKCEAFTADWVAQGPDAKQKFVDAGFKPEKLLDNCIKVLGAYIGKDDAVKDKIDTAVDSVINRFKLAGVLPTQDQIATLRKCIEPALCYIMRVHEPRLVMAAASRFEEMVLTFINSTLQTNIPGGERVPARIMLSLPNRLGGAGIKDVRVLSKVAYEASYFTNADAAMITDWIEKSLPDGIATIIDAMTTMHAANHHDAADLVITDSMKAGAEKLVREHLANQIRAMKDQRAATFKTFEELRKVCVEDGLLPPTTEHSGSRSATDPSDQLQRASSLIVGTGLRAMMHLPHRDATANMTCDGCKKVFKEPCDWVAHVLGCVVRCNFNATTIHSVVCKALVPKFLEDGLIASAEPADYRVVKCKGCKCEFLANMWESHSCVNKSAGHFRGADIRVFVPATGTTFTFDFSVVGGSDKASQLDPGKCFDKREKIKVDSYGAQCKEQARRWCRC